MHLEQLRRQAKELRDAARRGERGALDRIDRAAPGLAGPVVLAVAQLTIARELGYASWPQLKAAADGDSPRLRRFLAASLDGPAVLARRLLHETPEVAKSTFAAAALGDPDRACRDVSTVDADRGWPPLLYACYSRWHQFEPARTAGLTETVRALLDRGADPSTHNGLLPNRGYRSALLGAVVTDKPDIVAALLARGALCDDRVSVRTAAELGHHRCLDLLLDHGASIEGPWTVEAAVFARDAWAVRRLLDAVADRGEDVAARATALLGEAAGRGAVDVVETLLAFGADPRRADGSALVRDALRAGAPDAAALLTAHGAPDAVSVLDRLIGACMRGERAQADRLLVELGAPVASLPPAELAVLVDAAARPGTASVELMLDLGWPIDARNELGETALHSAAYEGRVETVRLLLARGAAVDARDARFDSTPLAFATVGSRERQHDRDASGDWPATVRALLAAGAARGGVWLRGEKAPSDDVAAVLRRFGASPEAAEVTATAEPGPADRLSGSESSDQAPGGVDALAEVAALIRIAYEQRDLELFASLLSPDVRWGGRPYGCSTREQVVAEYRELIALGFTGELSSIEIAAEDTLIVELCYRGAPAGTRPPTPGTRVQVLRVADDLIVSIDGYPDLESARRAVDAAPAQRGSVNDLSHPLKLTMPAASSGEQTGGGTG
jgi:ankyrin repeat protein